MLPYSGDDWDWGLSIGLRHLLTADINSRYFGNLIIVLMSRSPLLKTLIMGSASALIPVLISVFAINGPWKQRWNIMLILITACSILLFTMDLQIWRQTYGWASGFANYNISLIFLILYLHTVMPLFFDSISGHQASLLSELLLFVMAIVMQLFLENLAAYVTAASVIICFIAWLRTRRIQRRYWLLLLGNLIGLAIMFSSDMYSTLAQTGEALDGVRTLTFYPHGGPVGMLLRCFHMFMHAHVPYIWENNTIICCTVSALLFILWHKGRRFSKLFRIINILSIIYFVLCGHFGLGKSWLREHGALFAVETAANIGYFVLAAIQTALLYRQRPWFAAALILMWISAPVVIAPLSALDMGTGRIYITSNVFMIVYIAMLLSDILAGLPAAMLHKILFLCLAFVLILFIHYGSVFIEINACTNDRMTILEEMRQSDASTVSLPAYPHSNYLWLIEPSDDRLEYFKEFYKIPPDVNVRIVRNG